jgi:hypothetical protein
VAVGGGGGGFNGVFSVVITGAFEATTGTKEN